MNQTAFNFAAPPRPADPATRALETIRQDPLAFSFVTEGWLLKNIGVWLSFYHCAERMWNTGRSRYGAKCVFETMRYETDARDAETTFKINNNYVSGLARLYNAVKGFEFFETRTTP